MKWKTMSLFFIMMMSLFIPHALVNAETDEDHVPIIFIHGYNSGKSAWEGTEFSQHMKDRLSENNIYYVSYDENSRNDVTSDIVQNAFEKTFKQAIETDTNPQVDVVAHSMGGLGVRWFLRNHPSYADNIRHIQFIATPHHGAEIAFVNRLVSILDEPELYYDLQGQSVEEYIAPYKKLYEQYEEDEAFNTDGKPKKYDQWVQETNPEVFQKIIDRQTETVDISEQHKETIKNDFGIKWLKSTENYRYSGAFEEYSKLIFGKHLYMDKYKLNIDIDSDRKLFNVVNILAQNFDRALTVGLSAPAPDLTEMVAESSDAYGVSSVHNMAQDRLMREFFMVYSGVEKDGRYKKERVIANPFLHKLNKDEYHKRYEKVVSGEKVPIYTTLRSEHSGGYFDLTSYSSKKEAEYKAAALATSVMTNLDLWEEEGHDSVVPLSSAQTKRVLFDRNEYYDLQYVSHSGLIHLTDVLEHQYDNPLTNKNDSTITHDLDDYLSVHGVNPVVLETSETFQEIGKISLKLSSQSPLNVRIIKRDKQGNYIDSFEEIPLVMNDEGRAENFLTLTYDEDVHDYLLFSLSDKMIATSHLKFSVESYDEDDDESDDEFNKHVQSKTETKDAPYDLSPIETSIDMGVVNHRFQVTHNYKSSDESVKKLTTKDFKVFAHKYGDRDNISPVYPFDVTLEKTNIKQDEQNIVLALDYSGSMRDGYALEKSKNAAEDYIAKLPTYDANTSISVVGFSDLIHTFMDFTQNYSLASLSVHKNLTGGTSIYDTVIYSVDLLKQRQGKKDIILMTDGSDTSSSASIEDAIAYANEADISLFLVALGGDINSEALERLANDTGGEVFYTHDASQLDLIYENITTYEEYIFNLQYNKRTGFSNILQSLFANIMNEQETEPMVSYVQLTSDRSNEAVFPYDFEKNGLYRHSINQLEDKIDEGTEYLEENVFEPVKENVKDHWSFFKGFKGVFLW